MPPLTPRLPLTRSTTLAITWLAGAALLAAGILFSSQAPAGAEPPKRASGGIAVVDVKKLMSQSKSGKAAFEKLKKMQDEMVAKARLMDTEANRLADEIAKGEGALTEEKLAALKKQLADQRVAMKRYAEEADREMGAARDVELSAIEAQIKPVIDALSLELELSAVFNKFESGLVYAADSIEITEEVLKRLDRQ